MKKLFLLVSVFLTFSFPVFAGQTEISTGTYFSKALNMQTTYYIYLPPNRTPDEKFPVVYILHGAYGCYRDWIDRTTVENLADNYRMILVFPDGDQFGWYLDSPIKKHSKYETYITKELVPEIDKKYPTIKSRNSRDIMGLSMGGHGAFLLTAKHPNVFGSASSMSGILKLTNHGAAWHIPDLLGPINKNRKSWENNSVYEQAERFKKAKVQLLFDCGVADTGTGAIKDARQLHEKLVSLDINHTFNELPGTHSWDYWQKQLESHLNFHRDAMKSGQ